MIVKEQISAELRLFITTNKEELNSEKAIDRFCDKIAEIMENAIKSATITIPTGLIQTQGTAVAQTNVAPIVLNKSIT